MIETPVITVIGGNASYAPLLGDLLGYPGDGYAHRLKRALEQLLPAYPGIAKKMDAFGNAIKEYTPGELEEHYSKTFDLAPECVPYVGTHVFGEQENKRRWFLCGLAERYKTAGFTPAHNELPDHITVILNAFPYLSLEERGDLLALCLRQAVQKMAGCLEKTNSPYALLMQAVSLYVQLEPSENTP